MTHESSYRGFEQPSINDLHDEALVETFVNGIGKNTLILTPSFPFVFIGKIVEVIEDVVVLNTRVTTIAELENRQWNIHVHNIEVFYIETKGLPRIPQLMEN